MDVGIHLMNFRPFGGPSGIGRGVRDVARATEEAGCEHLSVMDHYFQMDEWFDATDPMLEGYTTLGFMAAHTERVKLHLLVTGVTYRHPGLLAKIVTTLDVLSGGRAELAIGAAWYEREHRGLGVPYPPVAERFERLEETLKIVKQMWSDDDGPFEGKHYQLAETLCSPKPVSQPAPRIIIGGGGEKKTLRLVAQYADATNLFSSSLEDVAHKLDVLRRHCDDVGRDYDEITKTILYVPGWPSGEQFLTEMSDYSKLGVQTVMLMPQGDNPVPDIAALGRDIVPKLAQL